MQHTSAPVISRTWRAFIEFHPCGENWGDTTVTVTLSRTETGVAGFVDGIEDLEGAVRALRSASRTTVLSESRRQDAPTAA